MDVAVVGAGVIGLSCARELSQAGLEVLLVDPREPGHEASWAAAGILGAQSEAHQPGPLLELGLASRRLYPEFIAALGEVGYRACGALHLGTGFEKTAAWHHALGLRAEITERGLFFPDDGQVDNRLLVEALRARTGATPVRGRVTGLRDDGVMLKGGEVLRARQVVVCAGAWSAQVLDLPVRPVRGQMIALDCKPPESVVFGEGGYLVPRGAQTLVGATVEEVGFDRQPTPEGRAAMLAVAERRGVRGPVIDHWAGLRPATADGLPLIGRISETAVVATGHYRNGILLAPITARIVSALIRNESPGVDLTPFAPRR